MEDKIKYENGFPYVIIRGEKSGVFAGFLKKESSNKVILHRCRRIWYWAGASSLSELAIYGTALPDKCKFPVETKEHYILDVIEIIPCTIQAYESIKNVKIWTQHN